MALRSRAFALAGAACVAGALALAGCGQTSSGSSSNLTVSGRTLRIYVSDPANVRHDAVAQDVVDAERLAFTKQYAEVTDFRLQLVNATNPTASENAREAIEDNKAIAYLGEIAPGSSDQTVGITNALDLLQVSPTDTALELTTRTAAVKSAPQTYYQDWSQYGGTFARIAPSSAQEARAQVAEMRALGVTSLYVAHDSSDYGRALAVALAADAHAAGIGLRGSIRTAQAVFYASDSPAVAARFLRAAASTAPGAKLFGPSALDSSAFTTAIGSDLHNVYVTIPGVLPDQLNAGGKAFERAFRTAYHHRPSVQAVFGYAAMSALLRVIQQAGRSANDRTKLVRDFFAFKQPRSVLGALRISSDGDSSLDAFVIASLRNGSLVPVKAAPSR
ncbi:MAG: hypothetical protein ACRDKL_07425 [Solirubrobacteraceae bacterium]